MVNFCRYYTIVAPGTIQSNSDFGATVTLHGNSEPAVIKIGISGPSYNETKTVEVQPFGSEIVEFDVPPLEDGEYELQTEGLKGLIFERHSKLTVGKELPKVYIQMDKALYKPGDVVQYRIMALDVGAKPANVKEPLDLVFYDNAQNRVKVDKDIKFHKGVHTGKFQLTEETILGTWTLDVVDGKEKLQTPPTWGVAHAYGAPIAVPRSKARKSFQVDRYVLPKFSVEIESDKKVAILDKIFKITVRSKYTHGQAVKGNATITAYFPSDRYNSFPKALKTVDFDGKAEVEFHLEDDLAMEYPMPKIHIVAIVNEGHTGIQRNATTEIDVDRSRYTITVPTLEREYDANKPFEIKAIITKLNGSPVTNAKSTAKLLLSLNNPEEGLIFETELDENGVAVFKLNLSYPGYYSHVTIMYEEKVHHLSGFSVKSPKENIQHRENPRPYPGHQQFGGYRPAPGTSGRPFGNIIVDGRHPTSEYVGPLKIQKISGE